MLDIALSKINKLRPSATNLDDFVVIDTETSIKNTTIGSNKASPYHPDNKIVLIGTCHIRHSSFVHVSNAPSTFTGKVIVGHNVKFDALHLMRTYPGLLKHNMLWDTMEVEYLITGQQTKMASLDKLSEKYGLSVKDDKIKKYWENGVDTEDIPYEELLHYLVQDVANTTSIFQQQLDKAIRMRGMLDLIVDSMLALTLTTQIEYNGVYVDREVLVTQATSVHEHLSELERQLDTLCDTCFGGVDYNSNKELSILLWGGDVNKEINETVLTAEGIPYIYKSGKKKGQIKTKKVKIKEHKDGLLETDRVLSKYKPSVDEETLSVIAKGTAPYTAINSLCLLLLEYRELYKDFHTYYAGVGKLVWPHDSCLHGHFLHTVTSTGRLSSREPNMQNFPSYEED